MIGIAALTLIFLEQSSGSVGQYDVSERLRELDRAWVETADRSRRLLAIPKINEAATALTAAKPTEACRFLDEARAALLGRSSIQEDAISLRFDPPFVEPKMPARLRIGWAYVPAGNRTVRVQVGRQSVVATPGRELTIEVRPEQINPELIYNPEIGYLLPVQVGPDQRSVFLSIIKKPKDRLASLQSTKQPEAKSIVDFLTSVFETSDSLESDVPIIQYLFTAELLDEGRLRLDRADNLPFVKHNNTAFRATFPRQVRGPLTVVVALHGPAGSENLFFEGYGQGAAVTEAVKRNWAFVAPRTSATAIADVMDWIKNRRKQPVERLFIMGHSGGGQLALEAGSLAPKPYAVAAFAPSLQTLPASFGETPVFISVGKQDPSAPGVRALGQRIAQRRGSVFEEMDACEHLMVAAGSIPRAYRFFDESIGR